jgi:predicted MFS family arabinose efflux permease
MSQSSALAPFRVRSFRFQWPADLSTSWAFEMETLILGWFVLVETQSVLMLTFFASLQYLGTLIAPLFGVASDRIGHRTILSAMRAAYATLAATMMTLALTGVLAPVHVFCIAALMGIIRPSDMGMRAALVGDTMPSAHLMQAMSIERTTSDSARIAGALTGAGIVAAFGMGPAYVAIASLYLTSFCLTLQVGVRRKPDRHAAPVAPTSPLGELKDAARYVWARPELLATMCIAFLVNFCAYPLIQSLLPYVAKEIYQTGQIGLGYLVAGFASGALVGSIVLSRRAGTIRPARMMIIGCSVWYVMIVVFAQMTTPAAGIAALFVAGCAQSLGMVSMATLILRTTEARYRGRVMGLRMMAIYGVPLGLLLSGPLITRYGYPVTASVYCAIGLGFIALIALRWREHLWRRDAPANRK